jgi:hypothetical protein
MDKMTFPHPDELLLVRVETRNGQGSPYANRDPANPNVFRARNLLAAAEQHVTWEVLPFNGDLDHAWLSPDGRRFGIQARHVDAQVRSSRFLFLDVSTGRKLWERAMGSATARVDPAAAVLAFKEDGAPDVYLIDCSSGEPVGSWRISSGLVCLGPNDLVLTSLSQPTPPSPSRRGISLRSGESRVLLNIPFDTTYGETPAAFGADGHHLIWGNSDGPVTASDLDEVRVQLDRFGLGW